MADPKNPVLLNGGRQVNVALVPKAHDLLTELLADARAKTGPATLRVVKNDADKSFVAVLVAGRHVGFLSGSDAEDLLPVLDDCEQNDVVAQAKGTVSASSGGEAGPVLSLSLAEPGQLLDSPKCEAPRSAAEENAKQPKPERSCRTCGELLPVAARFCLKCGTPAGTVPMPGDDAVAPSGPGAPVTPAVSPSARQTAPGAQFSGMPAKKSGWWGRRSTSLKAGAIVGAVAALAVVGVLAGITGGGETKTAASSSNTISVTPAVSVATTTTVDVTAEERDFMVRLLPDLKSFLTISTNPTGDASQTYSSLHELSEKWGTHHAPSERTQDVLSYWLNLLEPLEQGWKSLAAGDAVGGVLSKDEVLAATKKFGALGMMVAALAAELGVLDVWESLPDSEQDEPSPTTTTTGGDANTILTSQGASSPSDGNYLVGIDLPADLYKGFTNGSHGFWQIPTDPNGALISIVGDDNTSGQLCRTPSNSPA